MLSQIEKHEIMNRTRGMSDDELNHAIKFIPTPVLMSEIARRDGVIRDTLAGMLQLWDDMTIDKPFEDMTVIERENLLKEIRRYLYYGE